MNRTEDRRSPATVRVSHTALVDICCQTGTGAPFQGESSNISGRGMHVKTSFLPEIGEELVCRFNHGDHEILVEGVVAWRAEGSDSGEFGIQFTALDADSADVLQSLAEPRGRAPQGPTSRAQQPDEMFDDEEFLEEGARVRLHIEGLGAPMKACVHEGSPRKVRVGSSLEFLKLGRPLELENVSVGERRSAHVDAVNVVMNPTTRIPELVVQLRYEGISPTPAPARADTGGDDFDDEAFGPAEVPEEGGELCDEEPESWEPAAEAIRARLSSAMSSAGAVAQKASGVFSSFAKSTSASVGKAAAARRPQSSSRNTVRPQSQAKRRLQTTRRRTEQAPTHLRSGIHDLGLASKRESVRPVASTRRGSARPEPAKKRRLPAAGIFGVAFVVFATSAFALRGYNQWSDEEAKPSQDQASPPDAATSEPAPKQVAKVQAQKPEPDEDRGVVAEVPLFGPQAMAVKKAEPQPSGENLVDAEKRAAAAAVEDQTWDDPEAEVETTEAKPWGHGRLYLPTIHRIRLDGAGTALSGAMSADGFSVVVPGRKAMESGKAIEKRDKRIVSVLTNNNARGATVKFEFRGPVPPYRVRLRQDFVEFLISAPEENVARL